MYYVKTVNNFDSKLYWNSRNSNVEGTAMTYFAKSWNKKLQLKKKIMFNSWFQLDNFFLSFLGGLFRYLNRIINDFQVFHIKITEFQDSSWLKTQINNITKTVNLSDVKHEKFNYVHGIYFFSSKNFNATPLRHAGIQI